MVNNNTYILKTDQFHDPWNWIKKTFVVFFFVAVTIYWEWSNVEVWYWKYFFLPLCVLFIYLNPSDDLAIDSEYFYYIRRSILPIFSKVKKYDLSKVKQIRCGGVYTPTFEFAHLLGYGNSNSIEILFKDDSSVTLRVQVYREELDSIISRADELIRALKKR